MTRLSPSARALIDQALLEEDAPTSTDRARNRAALASRIAAGGVIASTSAAAAKVSGLVKLLGVLALAGTFGVALSVEPVDPAAVPTPRQPVVAAPKAPTLSPRERVAPPLDVRTEAPLVKPVDPASEPKPAPPAAPIAQPPPSQDTLKAETALIRKAHLALRAGEADRALAVLAQHAREHPRGQLREEREAARALALCKLGRKDEAKRAAGSMLEGGSPLAERIKSACAF